MFRVARLHIGFLQLLEHCAVTLMLARPCVKQARIDILGLCAQESEVVDVRRIEAADEQRTMIVAFSRLMRQKDRKSVEKGKGVSVRVVLGGRRNIKKKKKRKN